MIWSLIAKYGGGGDNGGMVNNGTERKTTRMGDLIGTYENGVFIRK